MTAVKICGLRRTEDIEMVNRYLPEYAGFVFAPSKRQVSREEAAALREKMDDRIQAVGVFVNAGIGEIAEIYREGTIQLIQLHGEEDEGYIQRLREEVPDAQIVKAVRVKSQEQIRQADGLPCAYLLLDSYTAGQYGGSGKGFDKRLIPETKKPYFLAGGLDEENVGKNIRRCRPYAVDVSSAVETDGYKDEEKIRRFIEAVRKVETEQVE